MNLLERNLTSLLWPSQLEIHKKIKLKWAAFEEEYGDIEKAKDILVLLKELCSLVIMSESDEQVNEENRWEKSSDQNI